MKYYLPYLNKVIGGSGYAWRGPEEHGGAGMGREEEETQEGRASSLSYVSHSSMADYSQGISLD